MMNKCLGNNQINIHKMILNRLCKVKMINKKANSLNLIEQISYMKLTSMLCMHKFIRSYFETVMVLQVPLFTDGTQ